LDQSDSTNPAAPLKLLTAYLGTASIDEAIQTVRGRRILWLEILVNDQLDLTPRLPGKIRRAFFSGGRLNCSARASLPVVRKGPSR
ncbi:MAG: hypothetical protein C4293_17395, partial [Nitrospiraceae bacterium]